MRKLVNQIQLGVLILSLGLFVSCNCNTKCDNSDNAEVFDVYAGVEFDMPVIAEPKFAENVVSITDFGAVGDGHTLNTDAIAKAIDKVASMGGGKVIIPRGLWVTGPIVFKSNINLEVQEGALVLFSTNKDLYPLIETSFEGLNTVRCMSPIYGKDLENIAITGKGTIDGNGQAWRMVKKSKLTDSQWNKLVASGGIAIGNKWYPSEQFIKGEKLASMNVPTELKTLEDFKVIRDFLRPVMVSLVSCKNVLLDGPVFQNSPAWNVHPLMCENLIVRNISVRNPWFSQNGDGIDIESCKNAVLYNSTFDVGDDAICIKSGKDKDGRDRKMPNENLVVKNCIVYHGHGGVTVGSEMSSGVKNLHVSNCTFIGTDVGLRFKSKRGRGGVVEGIYISDIYMTNIPTKAISFNMYYGGKSMSEMAADGDDKKQNTEAIPAVNEETPVFKDIVIKNVVCEGADQAIYLQGLPEMKLANVHIENVSIRANKGLSCLDTENVTLKNISLTTKAETVANIYNSANVTIDGFDYDTNVSTVLSIMGADNNNISIRKSASIPSEKIVFTAGADKSVLTIK